MFDRFKLFQRKESYEYLADTDAEVDTDDDTASVVSTHSHDVVSLPPALVQPLATLFTAEIANVVEQVFAKEVNAADIQDFITVHLAKIPGFSSAEINTVAAGSADEYVRNASAMVTDKLKESAVRTEVENKFLNFLLVRKDYEISRGLFDAVIAKIPAEINVSHDTVEAIGDDLEQRFTEWQENGHWVSEHAARIYGQHHNEIVSALVTAHYRALLAKLAEQALLHSELRLFGTRQTQVAADPGAKHLTSPGPR